MAASEALQSAEQSVRNVGGRLAQFYAALPKETLRTVLLWALVLWLLYGLVQLAWSFVPDENGQIPTAGTVLGAQAPNINSDKQTTRFDMAAVNKWQLFGVKGEAPAVVDAAPLLGDLSDEESNAEETRLQLTLNGMIESDTEKNSRAVITYQGKQDQYAIGDKLPVQGRVVLKRLLSDRALISNAGKTEALYLFDDKNGSGSSAVAAKRPPPKAAASRPNRASLGSSMRDRLMENPMSITDVVRISEARKDGVLIGYKVRPSRDKEQFEQLGLQNDDIVLAVNGVALDNVSNAMQVFQTLRTETEASFDISRSGENISLVVSLDDVAADQEQP